jgi:hypothetical protein
MGLAPGVAFWAATMGANAAANKRTTAEIETGKNLCRDTLPLLA